MLGFSSEYIEEAGKVYEVRKFNNGTVHSWEEWYHKGVIHREIGPAQIFQNSYCWFKNGLKHRDDNPAYYNVSISGVKTLAWFQNSNFHREDGPAYIYGDKFKIFYLNGKELSEKNFLHELKDRIIVVNSRLYLIDGRPIHGLS